MVRIVIIGAGLGGLAAAAFLRKNHEVIILERSQLDFTRNDYGLTVMCNAYGLLLKAGLCEANLDMATLIKFWTRTADNAEIRTTELDTRILFGVPSVMTRRSSLQAELWRMATSAGLEGLPAKVLQGCKVETVDAVTGMVYASDGTIYTGDLVIGADGINSVARGAVRSLDGRGRGEGTAATHDLLAFMAQVPMSAVQDVPELAFLHDPETRAGLVTWASSKGMSDKRRMLAYHVNERELQLVGYTSEQEFTARFDQEKTSIIKNVPFERAQREFPDFSLAMTELFKHHRTGDGTVEAWRIRDIDQVDQWHKGRLLLIGDAVHAVTPHAGQGCNIAFEDAEALGYLLADARSQAEIATTIKSFVKIRKDRAQDVARSSRHMGAILKSEDGEDLGPFDIRAFIDRTYNYVGAEAALKHAVESS